jgi:hypothetical protein
MFCMSEVVGAECDLERGGQRRFRFERTGRALLKKSNKNLLGLLVGHLVGHGRYY